MQQYNENVAWDYKFLELAFHITKWSKDPSTKVGAVLVDNKNRVVGMGYNGFPRGVSDDERLLDREVKYSMVIHAEANAILNAIGSVEGTTIYSTLKPCSNCTSLLINAGVGRFMYPAPTGEVAERFKTSFEIADRMIFEARIRTREL